jgi:hypothetical protein
VLKRRNEGCCSPEYPDVLLSRQRQASLPRRSTTPRNKKNTRTRRCMGDRRVSSEIRRLQRVDLSDTIAQSQPAQSHSFSCELGLFPTRGFKHNY